jgi:hypothetical protein
MHSIQFDLTLGCILNPHHRTGLVNILIELYKNILFVTSSIVIIPWDFFDI